MLGFGQTESTLMPTLATHTANTIRAVVRKLGYELIKTHRFAEIENRQSLLLDIAIAAQAQQFDAKSTPQGIVFSKDRPLQLHLTLASYRLQVKNPMPLTILYCASNPAYAKAYAEVAASFPKSAKFTFVEEKGGFKATLLQVLNSLTCAKMFFLTDDDVFVQPLDMAEFTSFDPLTTVVSPTLSPQVKYAHVLQREVRRPKGFEKVKGHPEMVSFTWSDGEAQWDYPFSVDGNLFSTAEVRTIAAVTAYKAPNTFEWALMQYGDRGRARQGVCYTKARIMNLPINRVQTEYANYAGTMAVEGLLKAWQEGKCIDPMPYSGMDFEGFKVEDPLTVVPFVLKNR